MTQLVGTACRLVTAADATETRNNLVRIHPLHKSTDALQVSMASTYKRYVAYTVVVVYFEIYNFTTSI